MSTLISNLVKEAIIELRKDFPKEPIYGFYEWNKDWKEVVKPHYWKNENDLMANTKFEWGGEWIEAVDKRRIELKNQLFNQAAKTMPPGTNISSKNPEVMKVYHDLVKANPPNQTDWHPREWWNTKGGGTEEGVEAFTRQNIDWSARQKLINETNGDFSHRKMVLQYNELKYTAQRFNKNKIPLVDQMDKMFKGSTEELLIDYDLKQARLSQGISDAIKLPKPKWRDFIEDLQRRDQTGDHHPAYYTSKEHQTHLKKMTEAYEKAAKMLNEGIPHHIIKVQLIKDGVYDSKLLGELSKNEPNDYIQYIDRKTWEEPVLKSQLERLKKPRIGPDGKPVDRFTDIDRTDWKDTLNERIDVNGFKDVEKPTGPPPTAASKNGGGEIDRKRRLIKKPSEADVSLYNKRLVDEPPPIRGDIIRDEGKIIPGDPYIPGPSSERPIIAEPPSPPFKGSMAEGLKGKIRYPIRGGKWGKIVGGAAALLGAAGLGYGAEKIGSKVKEYGKRYVPFWNADIEKAIIKEAIQELRKQGGPVDYGEATPGGKSGKSYEQQRLDARVANAQRLIDTDRREDIPLPYGRHGKWGRDFGPVEYGAGTPGGDFDPANWHPSFYSPYFPENKLSPSDVNETIDTRINLSLQNAIIKEAIIELRKQDPPKKYPVRFSYVPPDWTQASSKTWNDAILMKDTNLSHSEWIEAVDKRRRELQKQWRDLPNYEDVLKHRNATNKWIAIDGWKSIDDFAKQNIDFSARQKLLNELAGDKSHIGIAYKNRMIIDTIADVESGRARAIMGDSKGADILVNRDNVKQMKSELLNKRGAELFDDYQMDQVRQGKLSLRGGMGQPLPSYEGDWSPSERIQGLEPNRPSYNVRFGLLPDSMLTQGRLPETTAPGKWGKLARKVPGKWGKLAGAATALAGTVGAGSQIPKIKETAKKYIPFWNSDDVPTLVKEAFLELRKETLYEDPLSPDDPADPTGVSPSTSSVGTTKTPTPEIIGFNERSWKDPLYSIDPTGQGELGGVAQVQTDPTTGESRDVDPDKYTVGYAEGGEPITLTDRMTYDAGQASYDALPDEQKPKDSQGEPLSYDASINLP